MGHKLRSIHLVTSVLEKTMEMQRGVSVIETIDQIKIHSVTLLHSQSGQWPSVVETMNNTLIGTIGIRFNLGRFIPPGMGLGVG